MTEIECDLPRLFNDSCYIYAQGKALTLKQKKLYDDINRNQKMIFQQVCNKFKKEAIIQKAKSIKLNDLDSDMRKSYDELIKTPEKVVDITGITLHLNASNFDLLSEVWAGMWEIDMKFDKNCKYKG